jgi:hypothetical protein
MEWSVTALVFFIAELLTVPFMAWCIAEFGNSKGIRTEYHDAFTLAAIAPIPLWLSSLVLFSGNVFVILGVGALAVMGSVLLIFRGVEGILKVAEDVVAMDLAIVVTAMGLIAWVVLVVLGLAPALT